MSLTLWQSRYESWFQANWIHDDGAHDIAHLRRVWMSAQRIMNGTPADPLVVLTACYFHDVVNLPMPRRKPSAFCSRTFSIFRLKRLMP
jgi:uncharacterized protein